MNGVLDFKKQVAELKDCLLTRGYDEKSVDTHLENVMLISRTEMLQSLTPQC